MHGVETQRDQSRLQTSQSLYSHLAKGYGEQGYFLFGDASMPGDDQKNRRWSDKKGPSLACAWLLLLSGLIAIAVQPTSAHVDADDEVNPTTLFATSWTEVEAGGEPDPQPSDYQEPPGCGNYPEEEGVDTDGDGTPDDLDQDDDCDNLSDVVETDHLGTDPLTKNTDEDDVMDGLDLSPDGEVRLSARIMEIWNIDHLDCCYPDDARWGDPYIDNFKLYVSDNEPLDNIVPFSGLRSCDDCHPHDQQSYKSIDGDIPVDYQDGPLKDDIRFYEHRVDQTNFPKAGWEIVLKDHDGGAQWGDDLYDISPDGDSKVPQIFHSLWEIAHPREPEC